MGPRSDMRNWISPRRAGGQQRMLPILLLTRRETSRRQRSVNARPALTTAIVSMMQVGCAFNPLALSFSLLMGRSPRISFSIMPFSPGVLPPKTLSGLIIALFRTFSPPYRRITLITSPPALHGKALSVHNAENAFREGFGTAGSVRTPSPVAAVGVALMLSLAHSRGDWPCLPYPCVPSFLTLRLGQLSELRVVSSLSVQSPPKLPNTM
jgi:hypothetical protein